MKGVWEKMYNEALERAKKLYPGVHSHNKAMLEQIFPELAESEDERIIEDLIGGLMWQRDNLCAVGPHDNSLILPGFCLTVGEHLAYLEKQKEQNLIMANSPQLKEQKPAEWSEEDEEMIDYLIEALPMWANGRIAMLPSQAEEYVERLKSLRPQPKQVWTEEDERIKRCICLALTDANEQRFKDFGTTLKDCLAWVKDLLPFWKPSKEQMEALLWEIQNTSERSWQRKEMEALYNDLEKLM